MNTVSRTSLTSALLIGLLALPGCQSLLNSRYADSLPPSSGTLKVKGLANEVSVRRNALGMPLIESRNFHDALFALGYVHAGDRLSQMIGMRMLAEGRLAEMAGPDVLDIDRFMRTVNLKRNADQLWRSASPELKKAFEVYARGVNAYLYRNKDKLPMDLAESGVRPAYWKPQDSVLIFCLLNFGLATNLQEEINSLVLAQKVDAAKLPWLTPIYPDEPLPFEEADKLKNLNLAANLPDIEHLSQTTAQISRLNMLGVAASNNWAMAPQQTRFGKSILANDTHLPISLPSLWNFVQIRAPRYQVAGVSVAGVPAVVAGFNGQLAWGMTMVMSDNQDIFLERTRQQGSRLEYLADGSWQPARTRTETFLIKGQAPVRETIYETRHGPLLNASLSSRKHPLQPAPLRSHFGLALHSPSLEGDQTLDAFFKLSRAQSVDQAHEATRSIRAIALNLLYADAQHIAWQVTGRYPNRKQGRGLLPSPGWDGQYDWDGFADTMLHPYDQDPPQGWLGTANNRTAQPGYGVQLSSSWYYPERAERIAELASAPKQDQSRSIAMQYDQRTPFAAKLKAMFQDPAMASPLAQAIAALPAEQRASAQRSLNTLLKFDGELSASSSSAALYSAFLQESAKAIFQDELGDAASPAWQALVDNANLSYSAQADHLLGREDSPFWDDLRTPQKEDKPAILARSLAAAEAFMVSQQGANASLWQWGKLHSYRFVSDSSQLAPYLPASQQASLKALDGYLNRGPYPAGGDHSTLNVSAYNWGQNFDTWLIPAMRLIIDFSRDEPMIGQNSTGQSGNPASPYYADGIKAWQNRQYQSFPFKASNLDASYGTKRLYLLPQ